MFESLGIRANYPLTILKIERKMVTMEKMVKRKVKLLIGANQSIRRGERFYTSVGESTIKR